MKFTPARKTALPSSQMDLGALLSGSAQSGFFRIVPAPKTPYGYQVVFTSGPIGKLFEGGNGQSYESWFTHIHPEDQKEFKKAHLHSLRKGSLPDQTIRIYNPAKKIWKSLRLMYAPELNKGKLVALTGFVVDQTQYHQISSSFNEGIKFEGLIAEISASFIHFNLDEVEQKIQQAIKKIGENTEADHCLLFATDAAQKTLLPIYNWEPAELRFGRKKVSGMALEQLPELAQALRSSKPLVIESCEQTGKALQKDIQKLFGNGVKALLMLPLNDAQSTDGFFCLLSHKHSIAWDEQHLRLAETFISIYKNVQDRQRTLSIQVGQQRFLELLATGKNFSETLTSLIQIIEEQWPGKYALVMLKSNQNEQLEVAAYNRLPRDFVLQIPEKSGEIGKMPSCLAAKSGNRIITADLAATLEKQKIGLHIPAGIKACWSEPVRSASGAVAVKI